MKMVESSLKGQKMYWQKTKLIDTSNFSFFQRVFKRFVLQTNKNKGLFGKGLIFHPLLHKYSFCRIKNRQLLKTLWEKKQEGHDGPVSHHWLILGNLFKTEDPKEGLKLVAMSSNKKIPKYFTK